MGSEQRASWGVGSLPTLLTLWQDPDHVEEAQSGELHGSLESGAQHVKGGGGVVDGLAGAVTHIAADHLRRNGGGGVNAEPSFQGGRRHPLCRNAQLTVQKGENSCRLQRPPSREEKTGEPHTNLGKTHTVLLI